jgi:hypothetical protein
MANKQKYITQIKQVFKKESIEPSDELAKFFANKITDKIKTQAVIDEFKGYIKTAFADIVNDMAQDKINALKSQLNVEINNNSKSNIEDTVEDDGIVTTEDEIEGYFIVKSILGENIALSRIVGRDTKSYFGILLDDNNRKWICRLRFNTSQKYISIHEIDKEDTKYPIEKLEDIYSFKDKLKLVVERLS